MTSIFITGTDTDIGKTFVSAALVQKWGANYWKVIQTGLESEPEDTKTIQQLIKDPAQRPPIVQPGLVYDKPLSPWRCTVLENKPQIDISSLQIPTELQQSDKPLILEGAGGVYVPITGSKITTDIIHHFDVPVIVVARSELGTLNHVLLTIEHLKYNRVEILGVILNGPPNEDNAKCLQAYGVTILAQIPTAESIDAVQDFIPPLTEVLANRAD